MTEVLASTGREVRRQRRLLHQRGKLAEAEVVLGKKHPQTLNARGALAMVLLELRGPVEVRTAARPLPTS